MSVRAVTFDFWNTVVRVEGDSTQRRGAMVQAVLADHEIERSLEVVEPALAFVRDRFDVEWRANRQYLLAGAIDDLLHVLGAEPSDAVVDDMRRRWLADGRSTAVTVTEVDLMVLLEALRDRGLRLGIVCDAGLMPGAVLRGHLATLGLLDGFDHLAFSDEVGAYKPDPAIFSAAFAGLGAEPGQVLHVGDLHRTDVAGARGAGARAVRYRGVYDDPEAPAGDRPVIDRLVELVDLLEG